MSNEQQHPFALSTSQLEAVLNSNAEESSLPTVTEMRGELGDVTTLAIGEEGGDLPGPIIEGEGDGTTERLGEEGGTEPRELPPPDNFPDPGDIVVNPEVISITEPATEEGGDFLEPDFPPATGILAEQGGFVSDPLPIAITQAIGEEGGDGLTEVLAEQGEIPTEPGDEQGGVFTRAEGEDGDTVITFAEGEDGSIIDLGDAIAPTTFALGEEGGGGGDIDDVEIAEVAADIGLTGGEDQGNFEATTLALGEEGGFNDIAYVELYPAIDAAIQDGLLASPSEHYLNFGQFEPDRIGIFSGTPGNDTIAGFGNNTTIAGVPIFGYDAIAGNFIFGTNGAGEFDVLIGGFGVGQSDRFILGESQSPAFYTGFGNSDFALIQNFDLVSDEILLPGAVGDYSFQTVNNSTNISTASGDLIAIVENIPNLQNATISFLG